VDRSQLIAAFTNNIPAALATELTDEYLQMRQDLATGTLGRASAGKFVETFVQVLEHLDVGSHSRKRDVDEYLRTLESKSKNLPDGLRIVAARVGRSMYTMRNKRNIAHKDEVDPNRFDLEYLVGSARWVLAELIRVVSGLPMKQAGALVEQLTPPVGGLVQDFGNRRMVLADMGITDELLVVMHSYHPKPLRLAALRACMDRRQPNRVLDVVRALWKSKDLDGSASTEVWLTDRGYTRATAVVKKHLGG
jgi:hypothetical protein